MVVPMEQKKVAPYKRVEKTSSLHVLSYRDYRLLWIGAFISHSGAFIRMTALGWITYQITKDPFLVALITSATMLPSAFLSPFTGTLSDLFDRRRLLIYTQMAFMCNAIFLITITTLNTVAYSYLLGSALFVGIISSVEFPARQTLASAVVPKKELPSALPLMSLGFNMARFIGPSVGGVLLAVYGAPITFMVNASCYGGFWIALYFMQKDVRAHQLHTHLTPIKQQVFDGFIYILTHKNLKLLLYLMTCVAIFGTFYTALMPVIAKEMLKLDVEGFGLATAMTGIGATIGLVTLITFANKITKGPTILITMALQGIALFLLPFTRIPWVAYILIACAGIGYVIQLNMTRVLMQLLTPEHLRGRVIGVESATVIGLSAISYPIFGKLAEIISLPLTIHLGGLIICIGVVLGWMQRHHLIDVH